jgi:hypothetical protein
MSTTRSRRNGSDSDETFTRAAWDTCADTEAEAGVVIMWELRMHKQKGVWSLKATAISTRPDDRGRTLASDSGTYPNARAGALSSYLFALSNTIAMMVESVRESQAKEVSARK